MKVGAVMAKRKAYIWSIVSFVISMLCAFIVEFLGPKVAQDGTLHEVFFLIPFTWLFLLLGVLFFAKGLFSKVKDK